MAFLSQLLIHQSATATITNLLSHIVTNTINVRLIVSLPTTYLLHERNSNPAKLGTWNAFRHSELVALDVCDWLVNRNCDSRAGPESPWYLYKERTIIKYASGSCYAHNAMHQVQSALFNGVSWHSVHHKTKRISHMHITNASARMLLVAQVGHTGFTCKSMGKGGL